MAITRLSGRKSSVLIISLWIMALLSLLALGLGRRCAIDLRIAAFQKDRLKADYIARAGVKKAVWLLDNGVVSCDSGNQGLFIQSWDQEQADVFKIGNFSPAGDFILGFQDEESRLNINGIGNIIDTKILLKRLLQEKNIADAEGAATAVGDWIDDDIEAGQPFYKNQPLARSEELLPALQYFYSGQGEGAAEARKYARQTYDAIKDVVTVYGDKVNINTVPIEILKILVFCAAEVSGKADSDAQYLAAKIFERVTQDPFVNTGEEFDAFSTGNDQADALFGFLKQSGVFSVKSQYLRFTSAAQARGATREISVIYNRADEPENRKLVYWHER